MRLLPSHPFSARAVAAWAFLVSAGFLCSSGCIPPPPGYAPAHQQQTPGITADPAKTTATAPTTQAGQVLFNAIGWIRAGLEAARAPWIQAVSGMVSASTGVGPAGQVVGGVVGLLWVIVAASFGRKGGA